MLFSVAVKTVLSTGGSSGFGLMMATGFLKAGARVYVTACKAGQLQSVPPGLSPPGVVHVVSCDLATAEGVSTLSETLLSRAQRLHVLVNNEGAGLAIYLSSCASAFMTGNIITLDGGSSAC